MYNDNETPMDSTDDAFQIIDNTVQNGNLEYNATAIAEELDEEVWIGTERGIYVIYNPEDIFEEDGDFEAQRIKVEQDGNIEYLLENEFITAIAIDGGNRKWIGTQSSGVFVLSPDGINQIHHFTVENSPLLSNTLNDIAIDSETGEVFFSTDKGLISYKGIATVPQEAFLDVYSYPNPVPPGYSGQIGIRGLMYNTDIRITDITGNAVFATKSLGGQAIWDGNKLDGTRASSGVYLVFVVNDFAFVKHSKDSSFFLRAKYASDKAIIPLTFSSSFVMEINFSNRETAFSYCPDCIESNPNSQIASIFSSSFSRTFLRIVTPFIISPFSIKVLAFLMSNSS